jgi:hypothetical protein
MSELVKRRDPFRAQEVNTSAGSLTSEKRWLLCRPSSDKPQWQTAVPGASLALAAGVNICIARQVAERPAHPSTQITE